MSSWQDVLALTACLYRKPFSKEVSDLIKTWGGKKSRKPRNKPRKKTDAEKANEDEESLQRLRGMFG